MHVTFLVNQNHCDHKFIAVQYFLVLSSIKYTYVIKKMKCSFLQKLSFFCKTKALLLMPYSIDFSFCIIPKLLCLVASIIPVSYMIIWRKKNSNCHIKVNVLTTFYNNFSFQLNYCKLQKLNFGHWYFGKTFFPLKKSI